MDENKFFKLMWLFNAFVLMLVLMFFVSCTNETTGAAPDGQSENANKNSSSTRTWTDSLTGMEFIWIPGECFDMGQSETEAIELKKNPEAYEHLFKYERPRHRVCVDGFWIGKYEVTHAQFKLFIQATEYQTDAEKNGWAFDFASGMQRSEGLNWREAGFDQDDDHPVINVSWNDAVAMTSWLSEQGNGKFMLPTEAEWEYACRAGTETSRFWGDKPEKACRYANIHDETSSFIFESLLGEHHNCSDDYATTAPVGQFRPNTYGLYDMIGNVNEWCLDMYTGDNYKKHNKKNPAVLEGGSNRMLRGGDWASLPVIARSAGRMNSPPNWSYNITGFRLKRVP